MFRVRMMDSCKICSGAFQDSPDQLILCEHKEGFVHLGCCIDRCSMDGKPCEHSKGQYKKDK
ncbi:hypothetical protein J4399_02625 [Candidatus Woesearchaeota archaeon]|nr:hypothetical protein [Candidatus Woesearchaeota archaeon]HIJ13955.1 hypothetical protein [Candidatus Woesearchaeota archaeon]